MGPSLDAHSIDVVLSDIAPNMAAMDAIDQPRSMYLAELAVDFARQVLKPNGAVLIKTFQGAGFKELVESARQSFTKVQFAKPDASRARVSELYLLASGFRMV